MLLSFSATYGKPKGIELAKQKESNPPYNDLIQSRKLSQFNVNLLNPLIFIDLATPE
ncbi:hypothetical protein LEP1GSC203_0443 [Leptospira terpstrae serovar Hualin str. LT 11-33 = ATCC 700639]|uniref:Uncharacterized protein n=1 Tax=Leptospira terpstrae serovar Hualin str. LT 11-33 = ATCC 700639 TaxID=1257025 RepID=N1VLF0_9LEPT|nr:hypothetical protein LEP1GSC203_0443 [Leptospira terpstrae serovar Hualin str. LT 11-33 = ATCC 700639]